VRALSPALLALGTQWLLGAALFAGTAGLLARLRARRRWIVAWAVAARALWRGSPIAVVVVLIGAAMASHEAGGWFAAWTGIWFHPGAFVLLGAFPTASCYVVLHAGRLEADGRVPAARRLARLGGELLFAGTLLQLALLGIDVRLHGPLRHALLNARPAAGALLLLASVGLLLAAGVALTGGLARKPRPSCYVAASLYVVGTVGVVWGFRSAV
jgi:hypothetical protein